MNYVLLKGTGHSIDISRIDRSHRVGPTIQGRPRDIIVRFLNYRDRDLVYLNKKNLKSFNNNPSNNNRVFINEALTRARAKLFAQTRRLHKEKVIDGCWTMDGRIKIKLSNGNIVTITREDELHRHVPHVQGGATRLQTSTPNRR